MILSDVVKAPEEECKKGKIHTIVLVYIQGHNKNVNWEVYIHIIIHVLSDKFVSNG